MIYLPNGTVRRKGQPGLEDQGDDPSPVEQEAHSEMHLHVMESDMIHDKWECVHESKYEKGIGCPAMKHLESLV